MPIEYTEKPAWDIDLRDSIYDHIRMSWRLRDRNPQDALWHLNEAVALLYVARCASDTPEAAMRRSQGDDHVG